MWQLSIGYIMDILFGDPYWLPHPVRFIGTLISFLEKILIGKKPTNSMDKIKDEDKTADTAYRNKKLSDTYKKMAGFILLITVVSVSYVVPFLILNLSSKISLNLSLIIEAMMIYQILATKCLAVEANKVKSHLMDDDVASARRAVSYLVSRDTDIMDEEDIVKATVETISENTIDGIVSPILFILIGGAPLGWAFKSVNTLDSMVGYMNERYTDFGFASAKFDDVLNYIPARITAIFIIISSFILRLDYKNAYKILLRDGRNHASPNSPLAEAPTAGALKIQLGGIASYFGVISDKKTMGDYMERPNAKHISDAIHLMYTVSFLCMILGGIFKYFWV